MSRVIYRPNRPKSVSRYWVGGRLAWLYPEGTIIEHRGTRWENQTDFDSFPWWWPLPPAPPSTERTDQ